MRSRRAELRVGGEYPVRPHPGRSHLGIVANGFFTSQVGDMLGEAGAGDPVLSALRGGHPDLRQRYGGRDVAIDAAAVWIVLLCDVRSYVAVALKHWIWPVAAVDVCGGSFVTAVSSTIGLMIADWIAPKV
jgi:hypothetical protein